MDDRDRTAHQRLIESSRLVCEEAQQLIAHAREARDRAHATLRRLEETAAARDERTRPGSS